MQTLWPITWPESVDLEGVSPEDMDIAERFAASAMHHLTARRYGTFNITVMPCARTCQHPYGDLGNPWHPVLLDSGQVANCFCHGTCSCESAPTVILNSPVGKIIEVQVDGVILPKDAYRVEDGNRLVRLDGEGWPACAGDRFTVKYQNSYSPGKLGEIAAGYLAAEYLILLGPESRKKCRLPAGVRSVTRAGVSMEIEAGMFPDGVTGLREVDSFLMLVNPHALKTSPTIHSLGRKRNRQVTWKGLV